MKNIPLFPLNTVLYPGTILPLRIFETRYIDMISECLRNKQGFGVNLIREGSEVGEAARCFDTGTYAEITDWNQQADGLLGIVVQGKQRYRVKEYSVRDNKLLEGQVEFIESEPQRACEAEFETLQGLLKQAIEHYELPYAKEVEKLEDSSWLGFRLSELLPLERQIKQELLEINDPLERLTVLKELIRHSTAASGAPGA